MWATDFVLGDEMFHSQRMMTDAQPVVMNAQCIRMSAVFNYNKFNPKYKTSRKYGHGIQIK